jgi:hypothetical protein
MPKTMSELENNETLNWKTHYSPHRNHEGSVSPEMDFRLVTISLELAKLRLWAKLLTRKRIRF